MTKIVKVLIAKNGLFPLDYALHEENQVNVGDIILVPFRNSESIGIVWQIDVNDSGKKLKTINPGKTSNFHINPEILTFINKVSEYYLTGLGTIAKLVLPVNIYEKPDITAYQEISQNFHLATLSEEQQDCLAIANDSCKPLVIKGVTGSGKTEVYFHAVARLIKEGKQALIMLPEISLSSQITKRFAERFGFKPVIWHSKVTKSKKKQILRGIITGDVKIVIGTRSSLFLSYKNLGLIVVDEEHDPSYKQNDGIMYNGRDMAVLRANIHQIPIFLVSATPSIETIQNSKIGKYAIFELKSRFNEARLPEIILIDMRSENLTSGTWLSSKLVEALRANLTRKEQSLIFLNRRGYAPLMICKSCGHRFNCYHCSASMVVHKKSKKMACHHCGSERKIASSCPECKEETLTLCGPGIERIAEEVQRLLPEAKIVLLSRDQANNNIFAEEVIKQMSAGEIDILVGTQIVTKGYHFPNLTLVGIVDADLGFYGGDIRSSERTYQLLHQVSGRAGREQKKGRVLIQTYFPDNRLLMALEKYLEEEYIEAEIASRKESFMPPFSRIVQILLTSKKAEKALLLGKNIVNLAPRSSLIKILGPAEATLSKISGKFRYRILVITAKNFNIQKYMKAWLEPIKIPASCSLKIDFDPQNFA